MPAVKTYTRVNFQNYPSTSTPLNATNLNKMDKGIDDLDDEVVTVKNAIENMSLDADSISYDNTSSGLQATDVQEAVDEINDNLSGFKFYPSGTAIVGLISDDSAYTDADGNYVVWGTATANQLVEDNPNTYKAIASTEDTRGKNESDLAYKFGGNSMSMPITLENIKVMYTNNSGAGFTIDVNNYKTVKIYNLNSSHPGNIYYWKYTIDNQSYAITTVNYLELDVTNAHYLRFEVGSGAGSTTCWMSAGKIECL